jgi:hypothetical protein
MFDAVKRKPERSQELCHSFDGKSTLVSQAALRVFGLGFSCSMLDQVEAHNQVSSSWV